MARVQHNLCGGLAVLICLVVTPASIQAQEEGAFVQYRQRVMTANSANMGAINDILKNKLPYPEPYHCSCARNPAHEHVDL